MLRKRSEELLWENGFSTQLFGFWTFLKVDQNCYDNNVLGLLIIAYLVKFYEGAQNE